MWFPYSVVSPTGLSVMERSALIVTLETKRPSKLTWTNWSREAGRTAFRERVSLGPVAHGRLRELLLLHTMGTCSGNILPGPGSLRSREVYPTESDIQHLEFVNFAMCEHYESLICLRGWVESPRHWQPILFPSRSTGFNAYTAGGSGVIDEDTYQLIYKIDVEERKPCASRLLAACRSGGFFLEEVKSNTDVFCSEWGVKGYYGVSGLSRISTN